jgi:hypothetical protein
MFTKIVSGGQTGVDRAALDVALERGLPCGGWCPRGRRAEDGPLDARYPLQETPRADYPQRTRLNVRDSDGTLILTCGAPDRGTSLTVRLAEEFGKPHLVLNLEDRPRPEEVRTWAQAHRVGVLNVAGPRESSANGIYERAAAFLRAVLSGGEGVTSSGGRP